MFDAWTKPELLARWFGRQDWTMPVCEIDLRVGGKWIFVMVAGEGFEVAFHGEYREIVPNERIVADYGTPDPEDPDRFRVVVTFDEQDDGKTVLTLRQLHPSRERRQVVIGFGAVEYGMQTLEGLAAWLDG